MIRLVLRRKLSTLLRNIQIDFKFHESHYMGHHPLLSQKLSEAMEILFTINNLENDYTNQQMPLIDSFERQALAGEINPNRLAPPLIQAQKINIQHLFTSKLRIDTGPGLSQ